MVAEREAIDDFVGIVVAEGERVFGRAAFERNGGDGEKRHARSLRNLVKRETAFYG